jgi:hypothetical protein
MKLRTEAMSVGFLVMDKCAEAGCPPSLMRDAVKSAADEMEVELTAEETEELVDQCNDALLDVRKSALRK